MERGEPIYVDVRKWPDGLHWHWYHFALGEDTYGRWFFMPEDTVVQRGVEPPRTYGPLVVLLPWQGLYVPSFNARELSVEVYVDIVAAPHFEPGYCRVVDMDLDVIRGWDGRTRLDDEDEFEARRAGYPEELVAATLRTAREVHELVATRAEPFDSVGRAWLRDALSMPWLDPRELPALPSADARRARR